MKENYGFKKPKVYYFRTVDNWLYLKIKNKEEILNIDINDEDVFEFTQLHFRRTDETEIMVGIRDIFSVYGQWSKDNNKDVISITNFKGELCKLGYVEYKLGDVRGYNIVLV